MMRLIVPKALNLHDTPNPLIVQTALNAPNAPNR